MNPFSAIGNFFKSFGKLIVRALQLAGQAGLDEVVVQWALPLVREASKKFTDNPSRREWVIAALMSRFHIPESIARLAVELAVRLWKNELEKHNPKA